MKFSCHQVKNALKRRNEQPFAVGVAQQVIDFRKNRSETDVRLRMVFNQRFSDYHKKRGRNPFARHIGDDNSKMLLIHHKKVIKIAAHFFCRIHNCINIKFRPLRKSRKNTGKHIRLNAVCHIQFRFDTLTLFAVFCLTFQQAPRPLRQRRTDKRKPEQYCRPRQHKENRRIIKMFFRNDSRSRIVSGIQQNLVPFPYKHPDVNRSGK